jgi:hypothetical protein
MAAAGASCVFDRDDRFSLRTAWSTGAGGGTAGAGAGAGLNAAGATGGRIRSWATRSGVARSGVTRSAARCGSLRCGCLRCGRKVWLQRGQRILRLADTVAGTRKAHRQCGHCPGVEANTNSDGGGVSAVKTPRHLLQRTRLPTGTQPLANRSATRQKGHASAAGVVTNVRCVRQTGHGKVVGMIVSLSGRAAPALCGYTHALRRCPTTAPTGWDPPNVQSLRAFGITSPSRSAKR